jgi:hypothetical protein
MLNLLTEIASVLLIVVGVITIARWMREWLSGR